MSMTTTDALVQGTCNNQDNKLEEGMGMMDMFVDTSALAGSNMQGMCPSAGMDALGKDARRAGGNSGRHSR